MNRALAGRAVDKLTAALGSLSGKTVCVLGLSFKPNTDDIREAPAQRIIEAVQEGGATVRTYDPAAMERFKAARPDLKVKYCRDVYEAAEKADALLLVTEWNEFRDFDMARLKKTMKGNVFVDCRIVYGPTRMKEEGFRYRSFGRGSIQHSDE